MEFSIKHIALSLFVLSSSTAFVQAEESYTTLTMAFLHLSQEVGSGSASWLDKLKAETAEIVTVINDDQAENLLHTHFNIEGASSNHTIIKTGDIVKIKSRLRYFKDISVQEEQSEELIAEDIYTERESYRGISDGSTLCYEISLPTKYDTSSRTLTMEYNCDCDTELTYQEFLEELDKITF